MWYSFTDFLWSAIVIFAFVAYLLIPLNIIVDLFRRDHTGLDESAVGLLAATMHAV